MAKTKTKKILICGCDEVGRGSLVSEVYAAACILDITRPIEGLADSKKLTPQKRETLSEEIKQSALCWSIAYATLEEIEVLNIHFATLLAMKRAIEGLKVRPDKVLIDGIHKPDLTIHTETVIKGDDTIPEISAASILAKVARDNTMVRYHELYPEYGFDRHKGYFTKDHAEALKKYGPSPIHRKTYAPVKLLLCPETSEQLEMF